MKLREKIEKIVKHNEIVGFYEYSEMETIDQLESLFKKELKKAKEKAYKKGWDEGKDDYALDEMDYED